MCLKCKFKFPYDTSFPFLVCRLVGRLDMICLLYLKGREVTHPCSYRSPYSCNFSGTKVHNPLTVAGWGAQKEGSSILATTLQELKVAAVSQKTCQEAMEGFEVRTFLVFSLYIFKYKYYLYYLCFYPRSCGNSCRVSHIPRPIVS